MIDEEFALGEEVATLGDRIATARDLQNLSREQVAKRLGVRPKTIRAWENDQAQPRSNRLYMLAGILNCNVSWLYTGEGDSPQEKIDLSGEARQGLRIELQNLREESERLTRRIEAIEASL